MNNLKVKFFSKNLILFTISSIGTKFITFFLIPLYTNFLSSEEYGIIDLIGTIINISCPILTFSLDAVILRYCLDEECDNSQVITTGTAIWIRALLLNILLCIPLYFITDRTYRTFFVISYYFIFMFQSLSSALESVYRGKDKVHISVIAAFVRTLSLGILNIVFLTVFHMGMRGYVLATLLSSMLCMLLGIIQSKCYKCISIKNYNKAMQKDMQKFGGALAFNQIGWWLNNSLDKYVVIFFLGMSENGIYSMAYKIPTILSMLGNVFSDAWGISAIKEFNSDDASEFSSKMYRIYNSFLVLVCGTLLVINIPLAKILFANEFFTAWKFTGILLISSVFNSLSGFVGAFFSAAKDGRSYAMSTIIGGITNFLISIILVKIIGVQGVAVGTLISSVVIWIIRVVRSRKYIFIKIHFKKDIFMYVLLLFSCLIGFSGFSVIIFAIQFSTLVVLLIINLSEILNIWAYVKNNLFKRKQ